MPDHITFGESREPDIVNLAQKLPRFDQTRLFPFRKVGLGDVSGNDGFLAKA